MKKAYRRNFQSVEVFKLSPLGRNAVSKIRLGFISVIYKLKPIVSH